MGVVQVSAEETQVQLQVTLRGIVLPASDNIVLARERPARERLKILLATFLFPFSLNISASRYFTVGRVPKPSARTYYTLRGARDFSRLATIFCLIVPCRFI